MSREPKGGSTVTSVGRIAGPGGKDGLALVPLVVLGLITGGLAAGEGASVPAAAGDDVQEQLRARIEAAGLPARLAAEGVRIHAGRLLPVFYEERAYEPAWWGARGILPRADSLLKALAAADDEGLDPRDYHVEEIRSLRRRLESTSAGRRAGAVVDLELLLTDAFLTYGAHLVDGRVDPESLEPDWVPSHAGVDLAGVLRRGLEQERVAGALRDLRPPQAGYHRLRGAYREFRERARTDGWPRVPEGGSLSPGDTAARVEALRRRLAATSELVEAPAGDPAVYDSALATAVRRFQRRHGLEDDAVVGPATLAALNVGPRERARQLRLNLERWRWLPRELGDRHVRVNAADYELEVMEGDSVVLSMRAIVGRPYRKTPAFSDRITYLVFNPFWHVPHGLAVQDQLPLIKKDSGYLQRMGFRVFQGWGADARPLDPATIDWQRLSAGNFPYRLRQDPGPQNALGRVKFMFPNRFSVYLHDTPARELFAKRARNFSSGCIRLERSAALAKYLLRGSARWTPEAVDRVMGGATVEETVRLPSPVPVHLLYWTAWSDPDGTVQFRSDVYDRDSRLLRALEEGPPAPEGEVASP